MYDESTWWLLTYIWCIHIYMLYIWYTMIDIQVIYKVYTWYIPSIWCPHPYGWYIPCKTFMDFKLFSTFFSSYIDIFTGYT